MADYVSRDMFRNAALSKVNPNEYNKLNQKIQKIIASHHCFLEVEKHDMSHTIHQQKKHKSVNDHNLQQRGNTSRLALKESTTLGLLNKLTGSNKNTIITKIISSCKNEDVTRSVINTILSMIKLHYKEFDTYLSILLEIRSLFPDIINEQFSKYIKSLCDTVLFRIQDLEFEPSIESYDDYCMYIKRKTHLLTELELALELEHIFYNGNLVEHMIGKLVDAAYIAETIATLDIITEMTAICVKFSSNKNSENIMSDVHNIAYVFNLNFPNKPKKVTFKWEEILQA